MFMLQSNKGFVKTWSNEPPFFLYCIELLFIFRSPWGNIIDKVETSEKNENEKPGLGQDQ